MHPASTFVLSCLLATCLGTWPSASVCAAQDATYEYLKEANQALSRAEASWRRARPGEAKRRAAGNLYEAAIRADRPGIAEEAVAGGPLKEHEIAVSRHAERVSLRTLHVFEGIESKQADEEEGAPNQGDGWLARRITRDALEVWTPTHGWLFDGGGQLLHEARPVRGEYGTGREWYGAFLPDGRWVTTDLHNTSDHHQDTDGMLSFFSRDGQFTKALSCADLAPPGPYMNGIALLGWARSNKEGTGWVVNVGSEEGYATVLIGPEGPARRLLSTERWQVCYPRALGARGWYIDLWVPDDTYQVLLQRSAAGHGQQVGYPGYSVFVPKRDAPPDELADGDDQETRGRNGLGHPPTEGFLSVPSGNALFGFWPRSRAVFIGSADNATWFFDARGDFRGWLRGRRLGDAASNQAMLFRLEGSHDVVTLTANLHATEVRRFVWDDGKTAVALSLFDDLHQGLFCQDGKLVLAQWR